MVGTKVYVYDKDTGEFKYGRVFAPGETHPRNCAATTIAPEKWRMEQNNEQAFFRDGKWEYEPIPEDEQEEIEPDQ